MAKIGKLAQKRKEEKAALEKVQAKEVKARNERVEKANKDKVAAKVRAEALNVKYDAKSKKLQRYVRNDRVKSMEGQGWKVIKEDPRDSRGKTLGVRDYCNDLTLMEKK